MVALKVSWKKESVSDISLNSAYKILKGKGINIISLPGYGNMNLKCKDLVAKYKK